MIWFSRIMCPCKLIIQHISCLSPCGKFLYRQRIIYINFKRHLIYLLAPLDHSVFRIEQRTHDNLMYQKSCTCVCANVNINKWEIQIFTLCKFPCTFWCWEIPVHLRQRNWQYMSQLPVEYIEYTWDYMSIKASTWGLPMVVLYLGVSPFHFPRERVVLISWYELSKSLVPGDTRASAVQLRSMHDAQWCTTTWSIWVS